MRRSGVAGEVVSDSRIPQPIVHQSSRHRARGRDRRTAATYRPTTRNARSAQAIASGPAVSGSSGASGSALRGTHRRSATTAISSKDRHVGGGLSDVAQGTPPGAV